MNEQPLIRICVLGELQVWRQDGSAVAIDEWRTGKTRDLLRLLALSAGHPVLPSRLVEKLWPDVAEERRRNSLRTAASQIRRTMGTNCVVRQADGLVLRDAWVDAVQFLEDARKVHVFARDAQHEQVLALTGSGEQIYRDDFRAYDQDSAWARAEREHLQRIRHEMLCDAAAAALELGRFREALDLAADAVRLDRGSETAHRSLMRAHAELGEIGSALRVFESYRAHLAEELGADPSPQTRELHLHLLRGLGA